MERVSQFVNRVWRLYYDGFRQMTVGRTLWAIIIIKLVLMFVVLRLFFFPDVLGEAYDDDQARAQAVRTSLIRPR